METELQTTADYIQFTYSRLLGVVCSTPWTIKRCHLYFYEQVCGYATSY